MKIVFLGSGNVATHLAQRLKDAGEEILQIYSRSEDNATWLASKVGAQAITSLTALNTTADVYLVCVKDEAIAQLVPALKQIDGLVAHTSGATAINVLQDLKNYGVFYPLQTFSKTQPLNLSDTPICVEANTAENLEGLERLAQQVSNAVYRVDSRQRTILHLSAVFACNFSNHLYGISASIMAEHGLNFDILKPLIMETAQKIQSASPSSMQTGPAVRGDEETMQKHLQLLDGHEELQTIYKTLSESIKKTHL